jgi:hypothetical protein
MQHADVVQAVRLPFIVLVLEPEDEVPAQALSTAVLRLRPDRA